MALKWRRLAFLPLLVGLISADSQACEDGHWIESVSGNGRIVILEDGSVWEVDSLDTITSSLWLPISEIVACDDKLINTDDGESVAAQRIR